MHIHNTIIIGGGLAGLGCARSLVQKGSNDFLLITKNVGGRVLESRDHQVNYGAFYARKDYENLRPFLRFKKRIYPWNVCFYYGHSTRALIDVRNLPHLLSFVRLFTFLVKVYFHCKRLRRNAALVSHKKALDADPFLKELYQQPADAFLREKGWEYWGKYFINPVVWATAFLDVKDVSALNMCIWLLPLFIPTYEFHLKVDVLAKPFADRMVNDTVKRVTRCKDYWTVKTASGRTYKADSVVVATPIEVAQKLVPLPAKLNPAVSVYMTHLKGVLRERYRKAPYEMLDPRIDDIVITQEPNNTFLLYSTKRHCNPAPYFKTYRVIQKKYWHPAFHIGTRCIPSDRGNGLYVIGDHNFCSMEDAFTSGIYAAHAITPPHRANVKIQGEAEDAAAEWFYRSSIPA